MDRLKMKNPNAPAVKREAEEDWSRWCLSRCGPTGLSSPI